MKYFITLSFLIPFLVIGQVNLSSLVKKNGLSYEKEATAPFTGKAFAYFPDGAVQTSLEFKDGLPNGEIISWAKKDVKQVEGFLDNGKRAGTWKLYYGNGKLKKQSTYKNDTENGEEIFWFENGNVQKKGIYVNGKLNGKYEWYFENGQKQQEGFFVMGKEDGDWKEWFENGKQKMMGHFTNFEKNGNWTWWNEKGEITTSKNYTAGLVSVDKDNFDTYLEKMEYYISKKNYKESLKNVELAEATVKDKTEGNSIFMGLAVYHSKCYSFFHHYNQGEKVLLNAIGLTEDQSKIIQGSHLASSPGKIQGLIKEITDKDNAEFRIGNHIALALCYNVVGDTVSLQKEQQLMMEKGQMQDWIINISMELYKFASQREGYHAALIIINEHLMPAGKTEKLELDKAYYLIRTEKFEEANAIVDRYLNANDKNVTALLLKADIEMAYGNVDKMKIYENKAIAIDPKALSNPKN